MSWSMRMLREVHQRLQEIKSEKAESRRLFDTAEVRALRKEQRLMNHLAYYLNGRLDRAAVAEATEAV